MNLSATQIGAIEDWARETNEIVEVRLFGSRAKCCAEPDSDVDLAVTILGREGETASGIWAFDHPEWEATLERATGLKFEIKMYDRDSSPRVFQACEEHGIFLYTRSEDAERRSIRP